MILSKEKIKEYAAYMYIHISTDDRYPGNYAHTVHFTNFFRTSKPLYVDEDDLTNPCFQLIAMGGGYIAGEVYRCDFEVAKDAKCIITTQSSTKAYKTINGKSSQQYTNITLEENAILEYLSDNVIVYENGKFEQFNEFRMHNSATLIYTECFGPGWSKYDMPLLYEKMYLNTKIYYDDKLILYDNLKFEPRQNDEAAFGIMSGYSYCGTMLVINLNITEEDVLAVRHAIKETYPDMDCQFGVSGLDVPGLGVRTLAHTYYDVEKINAIAHAYFRKKLWNKSPLNLRKI
ncbi:urease accessory protein UreD [Ureaplasma miroungigenitalium]|uniref:Urease accessory protein UreD n=1 Tax=Ureaplasma miroungigenitalium TaxID=1042321 RepID=A0ABT3BN62_9BACT|nr:urease accessory protein UreD [Ureaplasma miroungigenitalium]MCV3728668.1 urease accessory protein UreD [Ureaplasma miroungigenitalium]MCV3734359.1 urease accessory protein UreD [Ureaplasma miroungigenitalium]